MRQWARRTTWVRVRQNTAPSWACPSADGHVGGGGGAAYSPSECIVDVCDVLECDVELMDERLPYGQCAQ